MQKASWRQDVDQDQEMARRARLIATEAQGKIACLQSGHAATVWVRCHDMRFSAPLCDACATERMHYAAIIRAPIDLGMLRDVPLVTTIGGIDLVQLATALLDGAVGSVPMTELATVPSAGRVMCEELTSRLHRSLLPSEQMAAEQIIAAELRTRHAKKRAELRETQIALHSPRRIFA